MMYRHRIPETAFVWLGCLVNKNGYLPSDAQIQQALDAAKKFCIKADEMMEKEDKP